MVDFPSGNVDRVQEAIDSTDSYFAAGAAVFTTARNLKRKQRRKKGIDEQRFKSTVIVSLEALSYSLTLFCQHLDSHDMNKPKMMQFSTGACNSAVRCIMTSSSRHLWDRMRDQMN